MIRSSKAQALGIDLGTTKSMACVATEGKAQPVPILPHPPRLGDWMPSAFCLIGNNQHLVGVDALPMLRDHRYCQNVVRFAKRYMRVEEPFFPRHQPLLTPAEVSSYLLKHLREAAEKQLGLASRQITEAVVTVPAYFGDVERRQTKLAAQLAGFDADKVRLLDEPIAAAFGLGLHRQPGKSLVMVVDLGGGTLDVTLLRVGASVRGGGFQELGRDGYDKLGGLDWDKAIARLVFFNFNLDRKPEYVDPANEYLEISNLDLYQACELAKLDFCDPDKTWVREAKVAFRDKLSKHREQLVATVTRAKFLRATQHLAERCARICSRLLHDIPEFDPGSVEGKGRGWQRFFRSRALGELTWKDIDHVYMVGGGSLVPAVQEAIRQRWGREPTIADKPLQQVAFGAAHYAATPSQGKSLFASAPLRSPHTIGHWFYPKGSKGPRQFAPVIRRNQKIGQERGFRIPVGGQGDSLTLALVEKRLDPDDGEDEELKIGEIRLTDLPPGARSLVELAGQPVAARWLARLRRFVASAFGKGREEAVRLYLQCLNDREMQITARFRGKTRTVHLNGTTSFKAQGNA